MAHEQRIADAKSSAEQGIEERIGNTLSDGDQRLLSIRPNYAGQHSPAAVSALREKPADLIVTAGTIACIIEKRKWGWDVAWYFFIWTQRALDKIAEHDVTAAEVEEVISDPDETGRSRTTGRPFARGWTSTGRLLFCVYELHSNDTVVPITAYEIEDET